MSAFKLSTVVENFKQCIENGRDPLLDPYIIGYKELSKFFNGLGSVFGFINSDVISKISILEEYRQSSQDGNRYHTVTAMIEFEKETGAISNNQKPSGARTLLRLHRALEFISHLFLKLSEANDDCNMGPIAQESYKKTLSKYHGFFIQKGTHLALYSLPVLRNMLKQAHEDEKDRVKELMAEVAECTRRVFEITDSIYESHNLHSLP